MEILIQVSSIGSHAYHRSRLYERVSESASKQSADARTGGLFQSEWNGLDWGGKSRDSGTFLGPFASFRAKSQRPTTIYSNVFGRTLANFSNTYPSSSIISTSGYRREWFTRKTSVVLATNPAAGVIRFDTQVFGTRFGNSTLVSKNTQMDMVGFGYSHRPFDCMVLDLDLPVFA